MTSIADVFALRDATLTTISSTSPATMKQATAVSA